MGDSPFELAKKEIQKAFVYSCEESARVLFDNYLDNLLGVQPQLHHTNYLGQGVKRQVFTCLGRLDTWFS
ncbi:MAG: hypothetical protein ACYC4H_06375 [Desulfocucumaceae bacterium]